MASGIETLSISALEHDALSLRAPLVLTMEQCDGDYIVKSQEFDLYAVGESEASALEAFRVEFVALYQFLVENERDLAGSMQRQLQLVREVARDQA